MGDGNRPWFEKEDGNGNVGWADGASSFFLAVETLPKAAI